MIKRNIIFVPVYCNICDVIASLCVYFSSMYWIGSIDFLLFISRYLPVCIFFLFVHIVVVYSLLIILCLDLYLLYNFIIIIVSLLIYKCFGALDLEPAPLAVPPEQTNVSKTDTTDTILATCDAVH